jgi:hypothetical protein
VAGPSGALGMRAEAGGGAAVGESASAIGSLARRGRRASGHPAGAQCAEDRGITPWLCQLEAPHVVPVAAVVHRVRGLAVRSAVGTVEARHSPQAPGRASRWPLGGQAGGEAFLRHARVQLVGTASVAPALGKRGARDTGRCRWDRCAWHRATHGAPPGR